MNRYERVEDSNEAAFGSGILAAVLEMSGSARVVQVECDPSQVGADATMYVHMRGHPSNVILRLRVDEVVAVPDPDEEPF